MRLFALILFFLISVITHAQNTFEHVFTSSHNVVDVEACDKSLELPNGDYVAMGVNPGCEFCYKLYYIRKYDHQGNLIFEKLINIGSGGEYPDLIQTKDGNLLFYYGYGFPTVNLTWDYRLYFYKMDLNGDTLFTKNYYYQRSDQNGIYQIHLNELADSSIVFSCSELLLKLNPTLDSLEAMPLSIPFFDTFLRSNKTEIISPKSYPTQHGDSIALIVYDNNLDSSRTIVFPDSNFTSATSFGWGIGSLQEYEVNKIFGIIRKGVGNTLDSLGFVMFDSTMHILWANYLVVAIHTHIFQNISFDQNSVSFYGSKINLITYKDSAIYYRFSLNGDSLQFKTFAAENIYDNTSLRDLKYCSEGYLISGYAQADTTGWKSYFAVLDTNGNVVNGIATTETRPMKVFNNPTTNQFEVELEGEKSHTFTLMDASGKIIEMKEGIGKMNFNIQNYSAGNYFLNITGDKVRRQMIIVKM